MNTECYDVIIVGAGLSGIGAAAHLERECPGKRYLILEGRERMGGTWDLFRYPGIRSDSDMHTLGYDFKPWRAEKAIADGPAILDYIRETAAEHDIESHIRYGHRVTNAAWSSAEAAWTIEAGKADTGETVAVRGNFLMMCSGYFSYEHGYTPDFPGRERFGGEIVHPQDWPEDLDYAGKRVVVIGSGATAMTLVPAMAEDAGHVVMLQRSPTYVVSRPDRDVIANFLRKVLPGRAAYALTRWKNIALQRWFYGRTRKAPEKVKRQLLKWVRDELGDDFDVEKHFTPDYDPWDQRLCLVPNSDLFRALRSGKASVVTDHVELFTETGIRLASGEEIEADIIVTATGLDLVVLGGVRFTIDGQPVDFAETVTYRGMMYSGVPNMVSVFGYINASWTLRADLIERFACRLINHMDTTGTDRVAPRLRPADGEMTLRPYVEDFTPGYMLRVIHLFPKQGDREPWTNPQDYRHDRKTLLEGPLEDGVLEFAASDSRAVEKEAADAA
ncbi:flavin-containing monooxygenase [Lentisalinibacter orientalis]|uniref:flavin-containing monooxygenase n=1 Tax=Lentisalinibacter orientalis TaxID=2992241 RepID=UPI0038684F6B